jgi:hypothetical protein
VVAILNDTTGTLVAGAHDYPDCAIGLILGTIHISYSDMTKAPFLLIHCKGSEEGPVRIKYKCPVPIYVFPEI